MKNKNTILKFLTKLFLTLMQNILFFGQKFVYFKNN